MPWCDDDGSLVMLQTPASKPPIPTENLPQGNVLPVQALLVRQAARFLLVGLLAVVIDFVVYRLLLSAAVPVVIAKTAGFITGAVFAYFANRIFTFEFATRQQPAEVAKFVGVYALTMLANVAINSMAISMLAFTKYNIDIAFLLATGTSAALNFLGMKFFVFNQRVDHGNVDYVEPKIVAADGVLESIDESIRLSLVIPCYNEVKNLPLLVARLSATFDRDDVEVVLVDNGSTDESGQVLGELLKGQKIIRSVRVENNQGYGFGILIGLRVARGKIIGWTHADMQTDPADALKALELFNVNPRLFVKGKRYGRPVADVIFTVGMSLFETLLLRRKLWDINAQPTLFPRDFFERWQQPPHDFSLDLYAYYQAIREGLQVRRLPVHFGERVHGTSHWNVDWRAKMRFIKRTVDFSLRLRKNL
jgi:polyisoprenyl-phosphate glycosyltransferase